MKKRILPLLLVLALCLSLIPAASAAADSRMALLAKADPALFTAIDTETVSAEACPSKRDSSYASYMVALDSENAYLKYDAQGALHIAAYVPSVRTQCAVIEFFDSKDNFLGGSYWSLNQSGYMILNCTFTPKTEKMSPGDYWYAVYTYTASSPSGNGNLIEDSVVFGEFHVVKNSVAVSSVQWNESTAYIQKGEVYDYAYLTWNPTNATGNLTPTYSSYDTSVAEVEEFAGYALIEGMDYGNVTIRGSIGNKTAYLNVQVCADSYGHNMSTRTVQQATCTETGISELYCQKCGWVKSTTTAAALGHDWVAGEVLVPEEGDNWGTRTETCSRCGESREASFHTCPADAFTDRVADTHWAHKAIDYVLNHGLMNGMSATKFEPNGTLTRAQLVTILYRLAGEEAVETEVPFTDLTQAWYKDAVAWAYENGIVNGMTETTFAPNVKVNRAMFATIMFRYYSQYLGLEAEERADLSAFPDAGKVPAWAVEPMAWANAKGLINGVSRGGEVYLDPAASATRAQAAAILMRFCQMME